jgi:hypothetical protein
MSKNIRGSIITRLHEIEAEHEIEILYAVESGSRAWGLESADSDYDIRFIYRHELKWYLNILPQKDVIEYPEANLLDISGWDLRKTLFLLNKSNPTLFEWLNSPIAYIKDEKKYNLLKETSQNFFSPKSSIYHYLHMAKGNYRDYLQGETVRIKKYFYVLRPLLSCMWIEKHTSAPPFNFHELLSEPSIVDKPLNSILNLLEKKKAGIELGNSVVIPEINYFIEKKIDYFTEIAADFKPSEKPQADILHKLFVSMLQG